MSDRTIWAVGESSRKKGGRGEEDLTNAEIVTLNGDRYSRVKKVKGIVRHPEWTRNVGFLRRRKKNGKL